MKNIWKAFIVVTLACQPLLSQAQPMELNCWMNTGLPDKLTCGEKVWKVPSAIGAIDLRGVKAMTLDCSSANPNCLYYVDGATSVDGLPGANVVCDGVCEGLLLTDTASFFCPIPFKATDAMLRLTPRRDDGEEETTFDQPCHETVMLPFDVDLVIPADVNGPMPGGWLRVARYERFYDGRLLFAESFASHLSANTPYIVEFAYAAYGTQILFCGQNKKVETTEMVFAGEKPYCFAGMTISQKEHLGYYRYYRGREPYFVYTGDCRQMEPFRCFVVNTDLLDSECIPEDGEKVDTGSLSPASSDFDRVLEYTIFEMPTAIHAACVQTSSDRYYDLSGRPVTGGRKGRGICIVNGIKVVK